MTEGPLSAHDLLSLARSRCVERHGELALALTDLFRGGNAVLTDRERTTMVDILRRLVREVEMTVRQTMAERLADAPDAPRALVRDLANDQIEVAWPILMKSTVLEDIDLIEIVRFRSLEHKLAVTQRGALSEAVADALARSGEEDVIVNLLRNSNARISKAAMEYLVEQSQRVDTFQEPLLRRNELTEDLAKRMFVWVSMALRDHIINRFQLEPSLVDDLVEGMVSEEMDQPVPTGKDAALIMEIGQAGLIKPSLVREAVASGQLSLYARIIEKLTGIRQHLALRLLFEVAGDGLAVLCRAIDIPQADFIEIYTIARKARPHDPEQLAADCRRLGQYYRGLTSDAARAVILHWRRHPRYLAGLREFQTARLDHG